MLLRLASGGKKGCAYPLEGALGGTTTISAPRRRLNPHTACSGIAALRGQRTGQVWSGLVASIAKMRIRRDEKAQCSQVDGEARGNVAAFARTCRALADRIVELWRRWQMEPKAQTTEHKLQQSTFKPTQNKQYPAVQPPPYCT